MEGSEASWGRPHQNCNKRGRKAQPDSEWGHEVALHAKAVIPPLYLGPYGEILVIEGVTLMEV